MLEIEPPKGPMLAIALLGELISHNNRPRITALKMMLFLIRVPPRTIAL